MKYLLFTIHFIFINYLFSQTYWQQKVDYTISVELDDINHYLYANETFVYTNNSPDDLNEIYIHLWPNAYKNEKTALAKQQYKNGNKVIHIITILERIILFFPYLLKCLKIQQENKTFPIKFDFVFEYQLIYFYYFLYILKFLFLN